MPPPVRLRTTCVEGRGVSRRDRRGDGRLGGGRVERGGRSGVAGEGELGQDWRGARGSPEGSPDRVGKDGGPVQVSQVNFLCFTVAGPQGFVIADDF